MRSKFFLCMRPTVIEPEDESYVKLPAKLSVASDNICGRRNRYSRQQKRVAAERYTRQSSIKAPHDCVSGDMSENPVKKDSQKGKKTTGSVTEPNISIPISCEKTVSLDKPNMVPKRRSPESNSGVFLMVSSLLFTIYLGKFFGILCTLILICSLYPHRKSDHNDGRRSQNMVAKLSEKSIILEGFLERKSHYRESIKCFS